MSKLLRYILFFSFVLLLAGCERRDLVDLSDMVRVRIVLKTDSIPNVTAGFYNENIGRPEITPEILRVMFFDCDSRNVVSQGFISKRLVDDDGTTTFVGDVNIYPGTYEMLCYNFDTPNTLIKEEKNLNTITAYTSEISEYLYSRFNSRAESGAVMPRIYYEPEHLFVARESSVTVIKSPEVQVIETTASTVIDTYYIQLKIKNGKYASDASAVVTDLAPSNRFGVDEPKYDEYAATFFEMERSIDTRARSANQEVLCATFNTFGKRPDDIDPVAESQLYVTFNVITVDGKSVELTLDMDSVFQTPEAREKHWLLLDYEFEIPEPDTPPDQGGGFKPEVEGWDSMEGVVDL